MRCDFHPPLCHTRESGYPRLDSRVRGNDIAACPFFRRAERSRSPLGWPTAMRWGGEYGADEDVCPPQHRENYHYNTCRRASPLDALWISSLHRRPPQASPPVLQEDAGRGRPAAQIGGWPTAPRWGGRRIAEWRDRLPRLAKREARNDENSGTRPTSVGRRTS